MALPDVRLGDATEGVPAVRTAPRGPTRPRAAGDLKPAVAPVEGSDFDGVEVTDPEGPEDAREASGLKSHQVTGFGKFLRLLKHCLRQVTDAGRQAGPHQGGFADARSESWRQYRARVAAREWLPDDYDGKFLIVAPAVFYNTVGNAGWALGNAVVWLLTHMFAFTIACLFVAAAVLLWLCFG
jgi:hypothetical protein